LVKRKAIHFVLSKAKDGDLLAWKNSLEDGSFNRVVNEILIAESEKKIANIPCGSKKAENLKTINSRLLIYDRYAIELIESFGPKEVTSSIKKIIRKHLNKNRQTVKHSKDDRYKLICDILNSFKSMMSEKEKEFSGVANKYQKLCDAYDIAIKNLFDELLSCASAPTMNEACNKLRNFNYIEIINDAYKIAFKSPPVINKNNEHTEPQTKIATKQTDDNAKGNHMINESPKSAEILSKAPVKGTEEKMDFRTRMMAMIEKNKAAMANEKKSNFENYEFEYEDEDDWD